MNNSADPRKGNAFFLPVAGILAGGLIVYFGMLKGNDNAQQTPKLHRATSGDSAAPGPHNKASEQAWKDKGAVKN